MAALRPACQPFEIVPLVLPFGNGPHCPSGLDVAIVAGLNRYSRRELMGLRGGEYSQPHGWDEVQFVLDEDEDRDDEDLHIAVQAGDLTNHQPEAVGLLQPGRIRRPAAGLMTENWSTPRHNPEYDSEADGGTTPAAMPQAPVFDVWDTVQLPTQAGTSQTTVAHVLVRRTELQGPTVSHYFRTASPSEATSNEHSAECWSDLSSPVSTRSLALSSMESRNSTARTRNRRRSDASVSTAKNATASHPGPGNDGTGAFAPLVVVASAAHQAPIPIRPRRFNRARRLFARLRAFL